MKAKVIFLFVLFIQPATAGSYETDKKTGWNDVELNTAADANYLSSLEKEIILEINKLRTNPAKYATDYIAPLTKNYKNKLFYYPGDQPLRTREGVRALHECVRELKKQPSLSLVHPSPGLSKATQDHVEDQSKSGRTGHRGSDRSTSRDRMERYGEWSVRIAENIAYGGKSARQIVIYLLIDDGIPGRGHRKNFLNPDFRFVGVATGSHPTYRVMSVMDFAGSYKSKKP